MVNLKSHPIYDVSSFDKVSEFLVSLTKLKNLDEDVVMNELMALIAGTRWEYIFFDMTDDAAFLEHYVNSDCSFLMDHLNESHSALITRFFDIESSLARDFVFRLLLTSYQWGFRQILFSKLGWVEKDFVGMWSRETEMMALAEEVLINSLHDVDHKKEDVMNFRLFKGYINNNCLKFFQKVSIEKNKIHIPSNHLKVDKLITQNYPDFDRSDYKTQMKILKKFFHVVEPNVKAHSNKKMRAYLISRNLLMNSVLVNDYDFSVPTENVFVTHFDIIIFEKEFLQHSALFSNQARKDIGRFINFYRNNFQKGNPRFKMPQVRMTSEDKINFVKLFEEMLNINGFFDLVNFAEEDQ